MSKLRGTINVLLRNELFDDVTNYLGNLQTSGIANNIIVHSCF